MRQRHASVDLTGIAGFTALAALGLAECRLLSGALAPIARTRLTDFP